MSQAITRLLNFGLSAEVPVGEALFDSPGTYTFVVPDAVTSVSVVAVGGGAGGAGFYSAPLSTPDGYKMSAGVVGGGGAGLGYINDYAVSPGQNITVVVGAGGSGSFVGNTTSVTGNDGQDSYFASPNTVLGGGGSGGFVQRDVDNNPIGGSNGVGGSFVGDGGGSGADGVFETQIGSSNGSTSLNQFGFNIEGGGGDAGTYSGNATQNAYDRGAGQSPFGSDATGDFGGGGGAKIWRDVAVSGASGAVRIIFGGRFRRFPDENVQQIGVAT